MLFSLFFCFVCLFFFFGNHFINCLIRAFTILQMLRTRRTPKKSYPVPWTPKKRNLCPVSQTLYISLVSQKDTPLLPLLIACERIRILSLFQHPYPICCAYARKYPFEGTLLFFEKIVSLTAKKYVSYLCEGTRASKGIRLAHPFSLFFVTTPEKIEKIRDTKCKGYLHFAKR